MCDKAIDSYLLALKFVSDWFVTNNMIEKLDSIVFSDDYIIFGDLDSDFFTYFVNDIGFTSIFHFNISLDDENFDYCDPKTINHFRHCT